MEAEEQMAEAQKRMSQTTLKRRQKFHPKRDVKPAVLAQANRKVIWMAAIVITAFLAIVILQAVLG
jgi:type IV secretory pathway component VirB8